MMLGEEWENTINKSGLDRKSIASICSDSVAEERLKLRANAMTSILDKFIESERDSLPPGITTEELRMLVDADGDGQMSHREICLGLSRILLADKFQQQVLS